MASDSESFFGDDRVDEDTNVMNTKTVSQTATMNDKFITNVVDKNLAKMEKAFDKEDSCLK